MNDQQALGHINDLAAEEHELMKQEPGGGLDEAGQARLKAIEVELDQCWDLLRQRKARRNAGQDPDDTSVRSADVVEGYRQ